MKLWNTNPANENRDDRRWRWLFIVSSLWCFGFAATVWGPGQVVTFMTVAETLIFLANALLGSQSSDKKHVLAAAFQVSSFLKFATLFVLLSAVSITAYSVSSWSEQRHIFTFQGLVLLGNGMPARDATVTLSAGPIVRSTVAIDGKFAFDKISLNLGPSEKVTIVAALGKKNGMTAVDLNRGREQFLQIRLSAFDDRVRIRYRRVGGHLLDFLVKSEVDPRWDETLSGKAFVVKNKTFMYLNNLIDNFSTPFRETYFYLGSYSGPAFKDVAERYDGRPMFVGGWPNSWPWDPSLQDILSVETRPSDWNLEIRQQLVPDKPIRVRNRDLRINPEAFFFWRFAKSDEFNIYPQNPAVRLYSFLTREYLPDDFGIVVLKYTWCGDSTGEELIPRDIKLLVAVLENVGKDPIQIGDVVAKSQDTIVRLRDPDTASKLLGNQKSEARNVFPPEILAPGEKIIFPMELSTDYSESASLFVRSITSPRKTRVEVSAELGDADDPIFLPAYFNRDPPVISIPRSTFLESIDRPRPAITPRYVFGPSYQIESIEVDGMAMPFRRFDPANVVIRSGSDTGSCPYAFTYASSDHEWISEGQILYGVNRRDKERTDTIQLHRFDGRILIRELESEVSYINSVSVLAKCGDGHDQVLLPRDERLRRNDRNYVSMKRGDELKVDFDVPVSGLCKGPYTLTTGGFYLPQ